MEKKFIDIDSVIKSKSKKLYNFLPKFMINYLKKITHQEQINDFINRNSHLEAVPFTQSILKEFQVNVETVGFDNIIENDRFIIAANHPLGGLDGVAVLHEVGKIKPIKALSNDLLMNVENLNPLFVPVNKHGKNPRDYIKILNDVFESDTNILYFPAGLVSRKNGGIIKDLEWKKSFLQKAVKRKRNIIPTHISGRNTDFFYNLANIRKKIGVKTNIEMMFLVDEMYKQKGATIKIIFGKPISYEMFDSRLNDEQWAQALRNHCYVLSDDANAEFKF